MKAFALFGPQAASATPTIAKIALSSKTPAHLRLLAIEALCRIGTAHPQALSTLVAMLQQDQPLIVAERMRTGEELDRVVAEIQCLELFRAEGAIAVPILLRFSEDREERVRRAVCVTIGAIGPRGQEAAGRLAEMVLADRSLDIRDVAAVALGQIGGTDWLVKLLQSPDSATRERAVIGLGHSPLADSSVLVGVRQGIQDRDALVRIAAIESLYRLTRNSAETAPLAVQELTAPDRTARLRAVRFLTQLGPRLRDARRELEALQSHADAQIRRTSSKLLDQIHESELSQ